MPHIGERESLVVRDPGLAPWPRPGYTDFALHSTDVPFEKRDVVALRGELRALQFSGSAQGNGLFGFLHALQRNIIAGEKVVRNHGFRIDLHHLLRFLDRLLVPAGCRINKSCQEGVWEFLARIGLRPQFAGLLRLLEISRGPAVVISRYKKLFL